MKGQGRLSKYCRIFQWVEDQEKPGDPEFARAIHDLCLEGALSPGGRAAGVTFLYPKDKAFRAEIVSKAYSNDADEAVKLIESLIIPDVFPQLSDFARRPVGNRCGVAFKVGAEGKGDVEVAPTDFSPLASKAGALAVWYLVRGRPPTSGAAYAPPAAAPRPARRVGGGARGGGGNDRACLACLVEQEYCAAAAAAGSGPMRNPYLARVVSLLNFLRVKAPELLAAVRPVLDYDPIVTFYLLVEPYKTRGAYLIPDELLVGEGGWRGTDAYADAVADYESFFRESDGSRDRASITARIESVRQRILADNNPRNTLSGLTAAYQQLAASNTIDGVGPILSAAAAAALGGGKKRWQDEFRFMVHESLQALRAAPFSEQSFCGIVRDIATTWPGNDYAGELHLSNAVAGNVAPRVEYMMLQRLVHSSDFLYLPAAPEAVGPAMGSMRPILVDNEVYNRNAVALENLHRTAPMVHTGGVSDRTLRELEVYARLHGGALPPAVSALGRS